MIKNIILLAVAGCCGTLARFLSSQFLALFFPSSIPYPTLIINIVGSFVMGVLFEAFTCGYVSEVVRLAIATGFLGAFTTFSTFSLESYSLFSSGAYFYALTYILLSNIGGIMAAFGGIWVVRILFNFI